ncbi:MAG: GNAT family N-acetyltransferase [Actinobacteria bacterium]|nr:GNAT family N-acetyltransferase [Actinomycetota bacterium]
MDRRAQRRVQRDRRGRLHRHGRRVRCAERIQGPRGLQDDRRGLGIREPVTRTNGIGRLLLTTLLDQAEASGFHSVIARIEASSASSRGLHESCGFRLVGIEREIGRKFGRWLDVAHMQCLLHERASRA